MDSKIRLGLTHENPYVHPASCKGCVPYTLKTVVPHPRISLYKNKVAAIATTAS